MKKLIGIMIAGTMIMVFCLGSALAEPIKWRMVTTWTPSINLIETDKHFAKLVNAMSGGRLEISVLPAGELVAATGVFDAVSKGAAECGADWPAYWSGKNTAFEMLGSYPMTLGQYDYLNWYYHGGGKSIYDWLYGKYNMVYFVTSVVPAESGIRSNVPIKSLADYKGKKLRMAGKVQGYILKKLGAAQVMVSGGEIYQALQLKTIDGAEWASPSMDYGMGFAEVTKYNITPAWHQPSSICGCLINKDAWNKLPDDLKAIVESAATATVAYKSSWYEYLNIETLKKFKEKGTTVYKLSNEELKKIEAYAWEYLVDEAKKNPDYLKVAQSMFQYVKDFRETRDYEEPFNHGRNPFKLPNLPGLK